MGNMSHPLPDGGQPIRMDQLLLGQFQGRGFTLYFPLQEGGPAQGEKDGPYRRK